MKASYTIVTVIFILFGCATQHSWKTKYQNTFNEVIKEHNGQVLSPANVGKNQKISLDAFPVRYEWSDASASGINSKWNSSYTNPKLLEGKVMFQEEWRGNIKQDKWLYFQGGNLYQTINGKTEIDFTLMEGCLLTIGDCVYERNGKRTRVTTKFENGVWISKHAYGTGTATIKAIYDFQGFILYKTKEYKNSIRDSIIEVRKIDRSI